MVLEVVLGPILSPVLIPIPGRRSEHEEFGNGIMSAIDFKMDLRREADPACDRVRITMSGKFLRYKRY